MDYQFTTSSYQLVVLLQNYKQTFAIADPLTLTAVSASMDKI